jgi:hypothetical protein
MATFYWNFPKAFYQNIEPKNRNKNFLSQKIKIYRDS